MRVLYLSSTTALFLEENSGFLPGGFLKPSTQTLGRVSLDAIPRGEEAVGPVRVPPGACVLHPDKYIR